MKVKDNTNNWTRPDVSGGESRSSTELLVVACKALLLKVGDLTDALLVCLQLCDKSRACPHAASRQIRLDLHRTLTSNRNFSSPSSPAHQQLERILLAFSWQNPSVGYCQGLNRYPRAVNVFHSSTRRLNSNPPSSPPPKNKTNILRDLILTAGNGTKT